MVQLFYLIILTVSASTFNYQVIITFDAERFATLW